MLTRATLRLFAAATLTVLAAPASAQTPDAGRLLDVPFVAQSADLCGGAALAMVLRYWGDRVTVAEDFRALVDVDRGGITTGRLVDAARARGWQAVPAAGATGADLGAQVARGRPPMALIEERPGVLHYVVVVAWTEDAVIVHDPARAPFREMPIDEFTRRWDVSERWMLVVTPGSSGPDVDATGEPGAKTPDLQPGCADLMTRGIAASRAGRFAEAERLLRAATVACPDAGAPRLELAGLRFTQKRWSEAAELAEDAAQHGADAGLAWHIAAAARYQRTDLAGALDALAAGDASMITLVEVSGATVTPHPVVIGATGLTPRESLDGAAFERARRRLASLPASARTRLAFRPDGADGVRVEAVVTERDRWPRGWTTWAGTATRAAATDTIGVELAGLAGSGERWSGEWRWSRLRPRVAFGLATPSPAGWPGVMRVEALWERQSFADEPSVGQPNEWSRRRVAVGLSDWATGTIRWSGEAALDRFDHRTFGSAAAGLTWQGSDDRFAAGIEGSAWVSRGTRAFGELSTNVAWRSQAADTEPTLSANAGVTVVSAAAPEPAWPGAGAGRVRPTLLRAHPLLKNDVVSGQAFGRRLWHATLEYAHPVYAHPLGQVAIVGFADVVRAGQRQAGARTFIQTDVGVAVRMMTPGPGGAIDLGVAYGLGDRATAVSLIVRTPWPGFGRARSR